MRARNEIASAASRPRNDGRGGVNNYLPTGRRYGYIHIL